VDSDRFTEVCYIQFVPLLLLQKLSVSLLRNRVRFAHDVIDYSDQWFIFLAVFL